MPRPQEIISHVKNVRGRICRSKIGRRVPRIWGNCQAIRETVDVFNGSVYWGDNMRFEGQCYPGHAVGVIPTRSDNGLVVQFSGGEGDREIVLGQVNGISNEKSIPNQLEEITGFSGWRRTG